MQVWDDEAQQTIYFSPSRNMKTYKYIDVRAWEKSLVGKPCRIFWSAEGKWFDGQIVRFNAKRRRFKVVHPVRARPTCPSVVFGCWR